jgi:D-glycero-D-manno-heptose 1,7-bisphosphate phosphatase
MKKALFLDRDGVINREVRYLYRIEDFEWIPGVLETCRWFQDLGYLLVVVTNQAGIARGYYTEADFHRLTDWMLAQFQKAGVEIAKVYYSPYHPVGGRGKYKQDSSCRKPNPGMLFQAQTELNLDLSASILVGDKESDIAAGRRAGVGQCVLVRSGHPVDETTTQADLVLDSLASLRGFAEELFGEGVGFGSADIDKLPLRWVAIESALDPVRKEFSL